ncbi:MAG: hypothetical protein VB036_14790, partial [Propionicimonas sp.]|nr:hypothetical protein [Propionicimonas sp.]
MTELAYTPRTDMSHRPAVAFAPRSAAAPFLLGVGLDGPRCGTETLPTLLAAIEASRDPAGEPAQVVLLVRSGPGGRPLARAREVRSLARHHAIAIVALDLPTTAVAAVHNATVAVAAGVHPDLVPVLIERIAAKTRTVAVLDSVARLTSPAPTLTQHVRSWFPGSCVLAGPGQTVVSGRSALRAWQAAMMAAAGAVAEPVWDNRDGPAPYTSSLPERARQLDPTEAPADDRWGARRVLEVTWLAEDPVRIACRLDDASWTACRNCGRRTIQPVCPFCSVVTPVVTEPDAAEPGPAAELETATVSKAAASKAAASRVTASKATASKEGVV